MSESLAVQHFAREHIAYLDRRIAAETKRAEASIAARKLAFDEDLVDEQDAMAHDPGEAPIVSS
jgi:hypothetical protein